MKKKEKSGENAAPKLTTKDAVEELKGQAPLPYSRRANFSMMHLAVSGAILSIAGFYIFGFLQGDENIYYECPESPPKAWNDVGDYFDYYAKWNSEHDAEGLESFRERPFGGRDNTYTEMKERVKPFKLATFGKELKSGDMIYESACGEGLNLLMTMEILKEELGIRDLVAYGNEYLAESTSHAQGLFNLVASQHDGIHKGKICQGDSTNLSFVPAATFDLAYTGFLDPLVDPLHRHGEDMAEEDRVSESRSLCDSEDPNDVALLSREQVAQEDWHAKWTTELIRIVKPGKLVVIEDVGDTICNEDSEWGGVPMNWWKEAAENYKWDVDLNSIRIVSPNWYGNRYNVEMRRNL